MSVATLERDVASAVDPSVLDRIGDAGTALAIWDRAVPAPLRAVLGRLDPETIDDIGCETVAGADIAPVLHAAGYPDTTIAALAADIAALRDRHAALTGSDRLALRLEVVETDACRRFHADHVTFRLLCTYVGPGTQWHRTDAPEAIEHVPTGAVAVFKGRLLLDPPILLHRSPPIADIGTHRLVLAIDPVRHRDRVACR